MSATVWPSRESMTRPDRPTIQQMPDAGAAPASKSAVAVACVVQVRPPSSVRSIERPEKRHWTAGSGEAITPTVVATRSCSWATFSRAASALNDWGAAAVGGGGASPGPVALAPPRRPAVPLAAARARRRRLSRRRYRLTPLAAFRRPSSRARPGAAHDRAALPPRPAWCLRLAARRDSMVLPVQRRSSAALRRGNDRGITYQDQRRDHDRGGREWHEPAHREPRRARGNGRWRLGPRHRRQQLEAASAVGDVRLGGGALGRTK